MPLFKEPEFDPERQADQARARVDGHGERHNVSPAAYAIPIAGAVIAILVAAYALTRPSVTERLQRRAPTMLEVELE